MPFDAKLYKFRLNISNTLRAKNTLTQRSESRRNCFQFGLSCLRFFFNWFRVFVAVIVKPTSFSPK